MAAPTIFRSSDASAPVLHGNAGSLVAVLDGCLVTGYGAQTALGWGSPYTAANKAVYRAASGVRHYLDIDDSAPDATALGRNARGRAYEVMTAVGTGTNPFPTVAQVTNCVATVKSTTTGTTARPWILIGDALSFIFLCEPAGTDPPNLGTHVWSSGFHFGEMLSALTGDLYRTLYGFQSVTTTVVTAATSAFAGLAQSNSASAINQVMARTYTGAGGSDWVCFVPNGFFGLIETGLFVFPNPVDGGLWANAIDINERGSAAAAANAVSFGQRGRARGILQAGYTAAGFNDQDTANGNPTGPFSGRTYMMLKLTGGMLLVETTAWDYSS